MQWLVALVKALLEWATAEIKKDTKASDADSTPQSQKDRWRRKIEEQEKKVKKDEPPKDSDSNS